MKFIGITGGVGAGKSAILDFLSQKPNTRVMLADEIAHMLMEPGTACYEAIRNQFSEEDIYEEDGHFHRLKLAQVIFADGTKREQMNAIVHPAVKAYVVEQYQLEQKQGKLDFLFLEAALLIEEHYDTICDELWYIYTDEEHRRARLKESRGYSDKKIDDILASQLREEEYRVACKEVIDNNGTKEETFEQLEEVLRRKADEQ